MHLALMQAPVQDGLTLGRIVADIPHNGSAIFIYLLTALSLWLIWQGSRTRATDDERSPAREEIDA